MMEQVMTPFTANAFYFCDPDGRTEFVQSREPYPGGWTGHTVHEALLL